MINHCLPATIGGECLYPPVGHHYQDTAKGYAYHCLSVTSLPEWKGGCLPLPFPTSTI